MKIRTTKYKTEEQNKYTQQRKLQILRNREVLKTETNNTNKKNNVSKFVMTFIS